MSARLIGAKSVYEFAAPEPHRLISRKDWGRTRTIRAERLTITVSKFPTDRIHAMVEGRQVRRDGSDGQGRRALYWTTDPYDVDRCPLTDAPQWVQDAVAEVAS